MTHTSRPRSVARAKLIITALAPWLGLVTACSSRPEASAPASSTPGKTFVDLHLGQFQTIGSSNPQIKALRAVGGANGAGDDQAVYTWGDWQPLTSADQFRASIDVSRELVGFDLARGVPERETETTSFEFKVHGPFLNTYLLQNGQVYTYNNSNEPVDIGTYDDQNLVINDTVDDARVWNVQDATGATSQQLLGRQLTMTDIGNGFVQFTLLLLPGSALHGPDEVETYVTFRAFQL